MPRRLNAALDLMTKLIAILFVLFLHFGSSNGVAQAVPRSVNSSFKGVELYSWKDNDTGLWQFSILPGTNGIKAESEILEKKNVVGGLIDLKDEMSQMAEGEQVFWASPDPKRFPFPPSEIVREIEGHAAEANIELVVFDERSN